MNTPRNRQRVKARFELRGYQRSWKFTLRDQRAHIGDRLALVGFRRP